MSHTKIIDGNSLLFRSFYATYNPSMPPSALMRNKNGVPTNAIYLFHNFIKKIKSDLTKDDRLIVCFDTGKKTFRSTMLESYKMQRKPIEQELKVQIPIARTMLDSLNVTHCEMEGYEADDLAGSLAFLAASKGDQVTLYTSDKDYFQLLRPNVEVFFLRKGLSEIEIYTHDNLIEKFGVNPDQIIDYKGLVGDSSDNFKGIPGIGDKTACKLLAQYRHLQDVVEAMKSIQSKTALNIVEHQEEGFFCQKLSQIITDLPVEEIYEKAQIKDFDYETLKAFYIEYDFIKFLRNLEESYKSLSNLPKDEAPKTNYSTLKTISSISELANTPKVIVASYQAFNYHREKVNGLYFADESNIYFLPADNIANDEKLKDLLNDENYTFDTLDLKALIIILNRYNISIKAKCEFDLMLATYLLDANVDSDVSSILSSYSYPIVSDKDNYQSAAEAISSLKENIIKSLKDGGQEDLYQNIELPLAWVLADMEIEGVPLDLPTLEKIGYDIHDKIDELKYKILQYSSSEINLNSPKQVATLLYDELGIPKPDKKGSTANDALSKLVNYHPIIPLIMLYRKYNKIVSSYTDSLPKNIFEDNKLHAIFNQALTTTGRLSMAEPNLQNISIRDEEAKIIRTAFFYPEKEYMFLSFDYSQIELRILAHISKETNLQEVFNSNEDIHSSTASKLFGVDIKDVSPKQRRIAKTVNFSIVYGTSAFGLSEKLEVSVSEAKHIIYAFYNTFPGIKEYEQSVIDFVNKNEYVVTMLGRRRYLPDIHSSNHMLREFSKRAAVNATIQGAAADLIKIAMIKVEKALRPYKTKMILQIHDELIFKVAVDELEIVKPIIKEAMEHALSLSVPLEVDGSSGKTWYEAK